jgi:hypothetical protein
MTALVVGVVLTLPIWPYSASWGYAPSGVIALVLVMWLVLLLARHD